MKRIAIVIGFTVFSTLAFAQSPVPTFGIPMRDTNAIEKQIAEALQKETGFAQLKDFSVNWAALPCLQVEASEINPDAEVGVCVVNASAFQVLAKAAIIRKGNGQYDVSIVYADVE